MEFDWDEPRCRTNIAKHGIDFEDAVLVFDHPVLEFRSDRDGEERRVAIGLLDGREIAVVYTLRSGRYRIISARRARENERRAYRAAYPGEPPERPN